MAKSSDDGSAGPKAKGRELTRAAMELLEELTGYSPEAVTGLQRDDDSWLVSVDVLELERVPSTTDVIANYAVRLDDDGELLGYERRRRFLRAETEHG
jgi:gas vesicle protein GvpO